MVKIEWRIMKSEDIVSLIRVRGKRVTKAREGIVSIFCDAKTPIRASLVLSELSRRGVSVNKSTIYRELAFLTDENIIKEVNLVPQTTHYELASLPHHHHLSCMKCGKISEVECDEVEEAMEKFEREVKTEGFVVQKHNLEFYGKCVSCV